MRQWDQVEAKAMGHSPAAALMLGMAASVDCYTVMIDGKPEGMIGMVPKNILEGEGAPWMLGTDAIYANPRALLTLSRRVVRIWRDSLPNLRNVVAAENARAIRYLRRLGFAVGDERVSVGGVDFVTFAMGSR
jgi:ribosomal protein S18 acetylase RimI-like enzyme